MPNYVTAIVCLVIFGSIGIYALCWPKKIQEKALRDHAGWKGFAKWNPWIGHMKTNAYLWELRATGVLALVAATLLFWVLVQ